MIEKEETAEVEVATEKTSASEEAAAAAEESASEEQQQQQQHREEDFLDQIPDFIDALFPSETNTTRGGEKNNNIYLPSTSSSNYQLISETTNLPAANLKCNYHQPNIQIEEEEEEKETDLTYLIDQYCSKTGESINNDYQQLMVSFPENTILSSGLNEDAYVNQQQQQQQLLVHEDQQFSNTYYNAPPNLYHEHSLTFLDPTVSPSTSGAGNPLPTLGLSLNTISSSDWNEDVYVNQPQQQQQLLVSKDQQLSNTNTSYNVPQIHADGNLKHVHSLPPTVSPSISGAGSTSGNSSSTLGLLSLSNQDEKITRESSSLLMSEESGISTNTSKEKEKELNVENEQIAFCETLQTETSEETLTTEASELPQEPQETSQTEAPDLPQETSQTEASEPPQETLQIETSEPPQETLTTEASELPQEPQETSQTEAPDLPQETLQTETSEETLITKASELP
nr:probable basic-leucine zipper transcription factor N [Procambarus clarkii]